MRGKASSKSEKSLKGATKSAENGLGVRRSSRRVSKSPIETSPVLRPSRKRLSKSPPEERKTPSRSPDSGARVPLPRTARSPTIKKPKASPETAPLDDNTGAPTPSAGEPVQQPSGPPVDVEPVVDSRMETTERPGHVREKSRHSTLDKGVQATDPPINCPYLGTINRHLLDFDFEKVCSISLSNKHVYACLICGKYFQGRGRNTHCYTHALEEGHYLFINLQDCTVYCLPENYRVDDASLNDIKDFLRPKFTKSDVERISKEVMYGKALDGTDFIPGCIGLNNLKGTDFFNVIIQMFCCVVPLRNKLLLMDVERVQPPDVVLNTLVELIRKIFNPHNFKGIVSPHEFLQAVGVSSSGLYKIGVQGDPVALLSWLLNRLHGRLHNRHTKESVVTKTFGGEILIKVLEGDRWVSSHKPFRMLMLEVPDAPIFKDSHERNIIPQVPIFNLLKKYDGSTESYVAGKTQKYSIWRLPEYLILIVKRFSKNDYFEEKNPTIVAFPMKNLDLSEYVDEDSPEKGENARYDLVCNVCHEGKPKDGSFKVFVFHPPSSNWYQLEDLLVTQVLPQFVAQSGKNE